MSTCRVILSILLFAMLTNQGYTDELFYNRIPVSSQYLDSIYNVNSPSYNNKNNYMNNNDGLVDEFAQCGGLDYEGPKLCRSSFICVKRSKYYSQCLTIQAAANVSLLVAQPIPAGGKCHGGSIRGSLPCATGTACFIQTENVHGECMSYCPQAWFCTKQTLPEWAPCGGDGYIGITKCKDTLQCVPHSKWYHECRSECPTGWKC
jgi:hypothetical protein